MNPFRINFCSGSIFTFGRVVPVLPCRRKENELSCDVSTRDEPIYDKPKRTKDLLKNHSERTRERENHNSNRRRGLKTYISRQGGNRKDFGQKEQKTLIHFDKRNVRCVTSIDFGPLFCGININIT